MLLAQVDSMLSADAAATSRGLLAVAHTLSLGLRGEINQPARRRTEPGDSSHQASTTSSTGPAHIQLRLAIYTDDLPTAYPLYEPSGAPPATPHDLHQVVLGGIFSQAELDAGELESANTHAAASLSAMARLGAEGHFGANEALRTLGACAYERDDIDEAERLLDRCVEIVELAPRFLLLTRIELARVRNAHGDRDAAFAELDQAREALPYKLRSPLVDRVDA